MQAAPVITSSPVIGGGALALADALGVVLDALEQRAAQPGFVGAAVRRRDGVAIGGQEPVGIGGPGHRPLRRAVDADLAGAAGENVGMDQRRAVDGGGEIVLQAVGEMEGRLLRHALDAAQELLGAAPADLDAAEQIGLGARHLEHALRLEMRLGAENLRIGPEADLGAAPVGHAAELFQLALRLAALEHHAMERLLARDLDFHALGQRIGDRDADAVQAARGLVDLGVEFAARVQRAHDHFERGLFREFRMRIDRNAAAVVGDGDEVTTADGTLILASDNAYLYKNIESGLAIARTLDPASNVTAQKRMVELAGTADRRDPRPRSRRVHAIQTGDAERRQAHSIAYRPANSRTIDWLTVALTHNSPAVTAAIVLKTAQPTRWPVTSIGWRADLAWAASVHAFGFALEDDDHVLREQTFSGAAYSDTSAVFAGTCTADPIVDATAMNQALAGKADSERAQRDLVRRVLDRDDVRRWRRVWGSASTMPAPPWQRSAERSSVRWPRTPAPWKPRRFREAPGPSRFHSRSPCCSSSS